jgi:hypothetical protein
MGHVVAPDVAVFVGEQRDFGKDQSHDFCVPIELDRLVSLELLGAKHIVGRDHDSTLITVSETPNQ